MGVVRWIWVILCILALLGVSYAALGVVESLLPTMGNTKIQPTVPNVKNPTTPGDNAQVSTQRQQDKSFSLDNPLEGAGEIRLIQENTKSLRKKLIAAEQREDDVEECIARITKNWVRVIDDEIIRGFDEDIDFRMRLRLSKRALEGEEICPHAD
ncbi:hypothetical protein HYV84_04590 [Candidatus Woesearchaeota archaeon]|nr:hypothetical protein [Candidatus Woesearchaeota archaeon]